MQVILTINLLISPLNNSDKIPTDFFIYFGNQILK